nr:hypothetical protein [Actinomycetota bacterium]NIT98733.1 hypothetical protein [Actinomycetota bacterium]NIU70996.1 hypothetical protein [Actinomycetota bacterium]NIV58936.1 hypothetical protein [Actinomycetota bacterium]NIV90506.1 hypothetical protein [Actinomycetota bacterium]
MSARAGRHRTPSRGGGPATRGRWLRPRSVRVLATTLLAPLLAFGPAERIAPTHWALIIGITDYIHLDDV